ncbi:MAG: Ig-like domain-containing protein [Edaphobacter sp.]
MNRITALRTFFALILSFLGIVALNAQAPSPAIISPKVAANFGKLPLNFEPNRGQTSSQVQWVARGAEYTLFLAGHDAVLEMNAITPAKKAGEQPKISESALRMNLLGANQAQSASGEEPLPGKANYFTGKDPAKWRRDVPMYGKVRLNEVYPGIDLVYYGSHGQLEYDFVVAPGVDASVIGFNIDGATPKLNDKGDLILPVNGTDRVVRFNKPVVYQVKDGLQQPIAASFKVAQNHRVTFVLGEYDHSRELVIDPKLLFLGGYGTGNQQTYPYGMTVDSAGEIMIAGITNDLALPVTSGALQDSCGSETDAGTTYGARCGASSPGSAFVTKISADGTSLVYSTYLHGGEGNEYAGAIATDAAGDAYVLGQTGSNDFPITSDAIQSICMPYHTQSPGGAPSVAVYPACTGFFNGGGTEYTVQRASLFLVKLNPTGSNILYGTFFGGNQQNDPIGIALDNTGDIYFAANTHGPGRAIDYYPNGGNVPYPTTANAFQQFAPTNGYGSYDGIALTKLSKDGHTVLYSTILTAQSALTTASTYSEGLAVGQNGIAAIGGWTGSASFPATAGSFVPACTLNTATNPNCQTGYGFVAAFDTTKAGAASLPWATFMGGTTAPGSNIPQDQVQAVAVDSSNNVYASGYTHDINFPTTPGVYQRTCLHGSGGCSITFLTKLAASNGAGVWSTYFGSTDVGAGVNGTGIVVDSQGRVNLYGSTSAGAYGIGGTFPVVNPIESANNNGNSLFLSTFSPDGANLIFSTLIHNTIASQILNLTSISQGLAMDATGNLYFGAYGGDSGHFPVTSGTYDTTSAGGFNRTFFGKISPILSADSTALTITPSTAATGQNVTFTVKVAGTTQTTPVPSGTVTLTNGSVTPAAVLGTITLDGTGSGSFSSTTLAAGSYSVAAGYSGDATYDTSVSAAKTLTVTSLLATTTALTVSPTGNLVYGQQATLTATVTKTGGGAPSGTVTFKDGSTTLGTGTLNGTGVATFTTTTLAVGSHSVTASYGGDASNIASVSGSVTVVVTAGAPDFSLALSPTSGTVTNGTSQVVTVTVTPVNGFTGATSLTCSGLPSNSTCSFSPASVTPNGTAASTSTLTIATNVATASIAPHLAPGGSQHSHTPIAIAGVLASFLFLPLAGWKNRKLRRLLTVGIVVFLGTLTTVAMTGCGGSGNGSGSKKTSAGAYTVTVTGTSGSLAHSGTFTLTVQ